MSTDPFNIVKEELRKSVNKTRSLIESYNVILKANGNEQDQSNNKLLSEIRTNLRSINWDIQDLEETINIASKNPSKFNLTSSDIETRRQFITQTREFLQKTKQTYNIDFDESSALGNNSSSTNKSSSSNMKPNINIKIPDLISNATAKSNDYVRLNVNDEDDSDYEIDTRKNDSGSSSLIKNTKFNSFSQNKYQKESLQLQHEDMFREQDKNIDLISSRVTNLKNISQTMQNELDDQANLLDDLGREMDTADSRMNTVMKKITKVLHMTSDKRQWTVIGILLGAIIFIIILFSIL